MKQWHPVFAKLLRLLVEDYYDVQTNMPVGDAPREADLVLLRRTSPDPPPFRGLWRHLTPWNVLEYKGPTVTARVGDLDLLVELGLGIHRRLNEERTRQGEEPLGREDVSFWLLANHLGRRFLRDARPLLGELEPQGAGVWRCRVLRRLVYLVSSRDVAVERDSVPLHLLAKESPAAELAAARLVASEQGMWELYGPWVMGLHESVLEEIRGMARSKSNPWGIKLKPMVDLLGMDKVLELLGPDEVMQQFRSKQFLKKRGMDQFLAELDPKQREELKRRLQEE